MGRIQDRCWWAFLLLVVLAVPGTTQAGPYFGDWGWCWKPAPDCPRGEYSCWHYWAPTAYWVKYCCHPANVDSYVPGLPVPVGALTQPSRCRTLPPMPSPPYADPAGYYGRAITPEDTAKEEGKETR